MLDDDEVKSNEYDFLYLFHHLKSSTSGADRSQYKYLSFVSALRSLLMILQQDNESTEGIYELLESMLLNLKKVGGNMHP